MFHIILLNCFLKSAAETTGQAAEMRYRISHFGKPNKFVVIYFI